MLFEHTYQKLLIPHEDTGLVKTETRRICKWNQALLHINGSPVIYENNEPRYWIGKREPITCASKEKRAGYFIITHIGQEDVRTISTASVHREGFMISYQFMNIWIEMHDKALIKKYPGRANGKFFEGMRDIPYLALPYIFERPEKNYLAWVFGIHVEYVDLNHPKIKQLKDFSITQMRVAQHFIVPKDTDQFMSWILDRHPDYEF